MTDEKVVRHTPGPWKIIDHMGYGDVFGQSETHDKENLMGIVGADGSRVLWFGNSTNYYPTEGDEPNQYDAHLIAAAPELLDALREIIPDLQNYWVPNTERGEDRKMSLLRRASAAIAKAEGRQI